MTSKYRYAETRYFMMPDKLDNSGVWNREGVREGGEIQQSASDQATVKLYGVSKFGSEKG